MGRTEPSPPNHSPKRLPIAVRTTIRQVWRDAQSAELRIEVHNGEHDAEREDVDAWILYSKGQHPGYSVTRLFGEEVFPVCSPQFRETLSAHPGADEVIGQPLLHDMYWDTDWPDWAPLETMNHASPALGIPLMGPDPSKESVCGCFHRPLHLTEMTLIRSVRHLLKPSSRSRLCLGLPSVLRSLRWVSKLILLPLEEVIAIAATIPNSAIVVPASLSNGSSMSGVLFI